MSAQHRVVPCCGTADKPPAGGSHPPQLPGCLLRGHVWSRRHRLAAASRLVASSNYCLTDDFLSCTKLCEEPERPAKGLLSSLLLPGSEDALCY